MANQVTTSKADGMDSISLPPLFIEFQTVVSRQRDPEDISPTDPSPGPSASSPTYAAVKPSPSLLPQPSPSLIFKDNTTSGDERPGGYIRRLSTQSTGFRLPEIAYEDPSGWHLWKSPATMLSFFVVGLGLSIAHIVYYARLNGTLVGDQSTQENNFRWGTAFAFLSQITLTACVWSSYTQWLWRSLKPEKDIMVTVIGLNAAFGVDTSVLSFLNFEMLTKFKVGSSIAFFAWTLVLPPFFTPATLFIYQSNNSFENATQVPNLQIYNSSSGQSFAYSPPTVQNTIWNQNDTSRTLEGPRSILTLIINAVASLGQILSISSPAPHSSYSLDMYGPVVRCDDANDTTIAQIQQFWQDQMSTPFRGYNQVDNAFYTFVPAYNANGQLFSADQPRGQSAINGTNELWMTISRYNGSVYANGTKMRERIYEVCYLYNATYRLDLSWDHGFQTVNGTYELGPQVDYPRDGVHAVSDMSQHAYSAVFWAIADQLVGTMGWFVANDQASLDYAEAAQFGVINTAIEHNSLLGSSDLDVYFDFEYIYHLYGQNLAIPANYSLQRQQDKVRARNLPLRDLIEELSFNVTVSLLHDVLLTLPVNATVLVTEDVNRYGYVATGLVIPYVLANSFTLVVVILGLISYYRHGVFPDKKFSDIAIASRNPEIVHRDQEVAEHDARQHVQHEARQHAQHERAGG